MTAVSFAPVTPGSRVRRPLRAPEPELHSIVASDGVPLRLTRYRAGDRGPVLLVHGLGVSSRIFTVDTIATNLLEFLGSNGFDVWLLDCRVSIDLPSSTVPWTADDVARKDYPAAVAAVRSATGSAGIDAIVHCYGATTFFMAMLAGLEGVRSAVCSQIATHVLVPRAMRLKARLRLPTLLRAAGVGALTARADEGAGGWKRAYDGALRFLPVPAPERCQSAVCHRISFMYGRLYQHEQLSEATHASLSELFGISTMAAFEQLARMVNRRQLVTADGRDDYLPRLDRLAIPITFIHGALNACYLPASTAAAVEALVAENGGDLYERHVIPGYGHIDCIFGKNAAVDVYPLMLRHFHRIGSGS